MPVGTVLPDREALVGYVNDSYVMINPDTGLVSGIGNLNEIGAAHPLDVERRHRVDRRRRHLRHDHPKGSVSADPQGDRIAEVDPATGTIKRIIGATGATASTASATGAVSPTVSATAACW